MKHKILLIALIISGYFGCEDLERKNPVDSNVDIIAPSNLQLSQQNIHTVLLSWNFSGDKYDGFIIDRKIGSDPWQIAYDTVASGIHSYTDTSAVPTESYTYRIYAYADENQSSSISKDITLVFPAPENLQLTQLSDTTVALQWQDKSDGEDGFIINRKKDSETWETEIKKTTATTWTDSTVSPGSIYSYQVKAFRGIKTTTAVEAQYQNIFQAPSNLSATAIDDQTLQLNWTDNCGYESGFRIERNDGSGFVQVGEVNANVTTYTDAGLTYGQSYTYQVKAYTDRNESDYSNEIQASTVFATPSDLVATAIDDQSLRLNWTDNCGYESGYRIERDDGSGFTQIAEVNADVTTYTDVGLAFGQSYTYRVKAFTDRNESGYSDEVQAETIFPAPSSLSAEAIDDQSIQLTWTDNCEFESGYKLERKEEGGSFTEVAQLGENITTYIDEGLTYGQSYTYRVKAFTANNESDYSSVINGSTIFPVPSNLMAIQIDDQSLQLIWADNCGFENGYRIERNDGSGFVEIAEVSANVTIYTDEDLTYGQNYFYRVKAFTSNNESDYSSESNIVEIIIPSPTDLTVTIIDYQSVQLIWDDNCTFETGYKVERSEDGGAFSEIVDVSANTMAFMDEGLIIGINYAYRIQAFTVNNVSNYSEEVTTNVNIVIDIDGNIYPAIKIGDQWWMAENLKVTHYRNGDPIPNVTDDTEWTNLTTGAYCNYDNRYGRLYNWLAVDDSRNIAPEGWHVPTDSEWQILVDYLGGSRVAGGKMKETGTSHWISPNSGATNESGFSALPGGSRESNGLYHYKGYYARFWSSTEDDSFNALLRGLSYNYSDISYHYGTKRPGYSVRCVRD